MALRNVLYLTTYCPALRDGVWELIFHQMLSIDVSTLVGPSTIGFTDNNLSNVGITINQWWPNCSSLHTV